MYVCMCVCVCMCARASAVLVCVGVVVGGDGGGMSREFSFLASPGADSGNNSVDMPSDDRDNG